MKVLIISTVRFRLNGITSVILNYYRNMNREDMLVDFVVPNQISDEYAKELESNGSKVYFLPRKTNALSYQKQLYKVMKANNYDVVHIHGNSAMMLFDVLPAVFAHIPVRIVHSHNTTCSHMTLHKLLLPIFNRCYTNGFACGQEAGKWLFKNKPFEELKNGIDLDAYKYDPAVRAEYRKRINAGEKTVIGHIGNFIEQKNHTFLIDWFNELLKKDSNYLLLLISDGALMDSIKQKVHDLGISDNVIFLGKTTEVSGYLQAMDMFVLPSLHEGLPVVLVEAQAAGLPCIVADTVAKEADLTKTMKYIPITDTKNWVDEVLNTDVRFDRAEFCTSNQKMIAEEGYDIKKSADRLKKLYSEYLSQKRR